MKAEFVIYVLFIHWIADFVFQDDETALKKSSNVWYLAFHSINYTAVLCVGLFWWLYLNELPYTKAIPTLFAINCSLHMFIDGITSRINAYLYGKARHWFFVSVGFDQFLHYVVLFWSLQEIL